MLFRSIEAHKPEILAFGVDAFEILNQYLPKASYSKLIKLTHYSHYISKEKYKEEVMKQISMAIGL